MRTLMQHVQLMISMYNNKIESKYITKFPLKDIVKCCKRIEKSELKSFNYNENDIITEELIRDENFMKYITLAYKEKYDIEKFVKLLEEIKLHNKKMSEFPLESIFMVLNNKELNSKAYYDFLVYFVNGNFEERKKATKNLNNFYSQNKVTLDEISKDEISLLKNNNIDNYNLIPPTEDIREIFRILANNKELINLIEYFNSEKFYIPLNLQKYQMLEKAPKEIEEYIKSIYSKIKDNEIMYKLLLKWLENDCSLYDLKVIDSRIGNIDYSKVESLFQNRTSYINFIYGSKLNKFPIEDIYGVREELIIYAIREKKNSFLKLIEENLSDFFKIPSNSILYCKEIYTIYLNLNEITLKNLIKLQTMYSGSNLNILNKQVYTFEEINCLYNTTEKYVKLYNELTGLKVDEKIIRIRQILKRRLLDNISVMEINKLGERLREKALYKWLELDFHKIKDITAEDAIQILIRYDDVKRFLKEIKTRNELSYVLRNSDTILKYNSLNEIKENIMEIDKYWSKIRELMGFNEEFIKKYSENIKIFLLKNGAELAYEYYIKRNNEQKDAFKLIVKSEIMGEFKKLKYHEDDLKNEIDYELDEKQIKEWTEVNNGIIKENYNVKEYDDFYSTMILGEYPQRTCLNYKSGGYNSCLLACFDSNKKILYAKINNKIVARAMIRLTKGSYNNIRNVKSLNFVDLEEKKKNEEKQEILTLFLEKPYISGISIEDERNIKKIFVELLKKKARKMNALLVLNSNYKVISDKQFIWMPYYMYISKSKSSSQYLDSLSGEAKVIDAGEYRQNNFLIWNT